MADHVMWALREAVGPALVLDRDLRVVAFTPGAPEVLGMDPDVGVSAPKILCGHGKERPVAEALAAGRAVTADILRPTLAGENRAVRVRATPIGEGEERGFLVMLSVDPWRGEEDETVDDFGIVTRDPRMKQLLRDVRKVARSEASVLVRGETGSGKELIAAAIHRASPRANAPFRALNCAALPPNLLESELFGHVRGAFTGAVRDAPGHFRLADGGTLFLDEVAELPLDVQAKLLRVLQERTVIPIGGRDPVPVDVRIVSATHRALRKAVEAGRFRSDLLYRLRVIPLYLPPLRERPGDIEVLVWHFLAQHEEKGARAIRRIADGALEVLVGYDWPGNVRELQNVVEYATVMGEGPVLTEADLPPEVRGVEGIIGVATTTPDPELTAMRQDLPPEARRLLNALERAGGHMSRAAASLGMSRTTLWRKLKKHGLDREAGGT
ncbi:MAG: sigma 54-interacting transcriptional regulator [Sandaracinaceae bacterium]